MTARTRETTYVLAVRIPGGPWHEITPVETGQARLAAWHALGLGPGRHTVEYSEVGRRGVESVRRMDLEG